MRSRSIDDDRVYGTADMILWRGESFTQTHQLSNSLRCHIWLIFRLNQVHELSHRMALPDGPCRNSLTTEAEPMAIVEFCVTGSTLPFMGE